MVILNASLLVDDSERSERINKILIQEEIMRLNGMRLDEWYERLLTLEYPVIQHELWVRMHDLKVKLWRKLFKLSPPNY